VSEWSWSNVRRNIHWDDFTAGFSFASLFWGVVLMIIWEISA
jgi:hypothetical protein